jgi:predicted cation transporter
MNPTNVQIIGTIFFTLAIIHTFVAPKIAEFGHHYDHHSWQNKLFHFLGEVECAFAIWSIFFFIFLGITSGFFSVVDYFDKTNFTEPAFVFVIMFMASTKPVIRLTEIVIINLSKVLPFDKKLSFYLTLLIVGPLLGSLITEPAAMTVCALILLEKFYEQEMSTKFKYATLGLLFVNISIGGTLTHFAAPPVVMVASKWGWDSMYMLTHFGYKAAVAIATSTIIYALIFRKELAGNVSLAKPKESGKEPKWWLIASHAIFILAVVLSSHHMSFFLSLFVVFLAFVLITHEYQHAIEIRPSLMVGIFLAGLVLLGQQQSWWLQPLLASISDLTLYFGATALTAVTDNAALTYLGSLVEMGDSAKYSLVAGAVTGGGLTVIANAPNPAGFGILKKTFPRGAVSPLYLFLAALFPTIVTIICFLLLGNL